jgi:hypothetical protein
MILCCLIFKKLNSMVQMLSSVFFFFFFVVAFLFDALPVSFYNCGVMDCDVGNMCIMEMPCSFYFALNFILDVFILIMLLALAEQKELFNL